MKKLYSTLLLSAFACNLFAYTYFINPAATLEEGYAETWEEAVTPAAFGRSIDILEDGDTIYIKGGVFRLKEAADAWVITRSVTIIGSMDTTLKGTDVTMPTYPSSYPTIFDGDANNDGKPSKDDVSMLMRVDFQDNYEDMPEITIQGIDFRNTYNYNVEEATQDLKTYLAEASALRLICGQAYVKNCNFYNHVTPINRGSQCVTSVGCNLHMMDCELHDCISLSRGALLRMRSYFIGGVESNPLDGDCVLERCALYNANSQGGAKLNAEGVYGGAVHASTGKLFCINTTFACDTNYSKGGAIRPNPDGLWLISCTFVKNYGARCGADEATEQKPNAYGSALGMDGDTKFYMANTIILDDLDAGNKKYAPIYSDDNGGEKSTVTQLSQLFESGGNNLSGTLYIIINSKWQNETAQEAVWQTSDSWSAAPNINRFSDYFTSINDFKYNGGCSKTILPKAMQNGSSVADLQKLADEWCPDFTEVDASVDQRGYKRDANVTCKGAAAYEAVSTGLQENAAASSVLQSAPCNILGQPVDENYRGIVIQNGKKYFIQ